MKRVLLFFLMICLLIAPACSARPQLSGEDTDNTWGSAPTAQPSAELTPLPTPEPTQAAAYEDVTDLEMTLAFDFGEYSGTYTGQVSDGVPDGTGSFTSADEDGTAWTYDGQWLLGHFVGFGTTTYDDGFVESGLYQNDYLSGEGWESWYDVKQYEGGYINGLYHGTGTLYNQHGEIVYTGSFNNGLIQETAEDRAARVGAFKDESVAATTADLYSACESDVSSRFSVTGEIFDIYYDNDTNPTFCDFLIYEQGIEDQSHIICVFYTLSEGEAVPANGQTVNIWGTTEYLYSYTSVDGDYLTVPLLEAFSVE